MTPRHWGEGSGKSQEAFVFKKNPDYLVTLASQGCFGASLGLVWRRSVYWVHVCRVILLLRERRGMLKDLLWNSICHYRSSGNSEYLTSCSGLCTDTCTGHACPTGSLWQFCFVPVLKRTYKATKLIHIWTCLGATTCRDVVKVSKCVIDLK